MKEQDEIKTVVLSEESLTDQLTSCRQRATKLEQDKEHWRLEYQLLQLRHCKVSLPLQLMKATVLVESSNKLSFFIVICLLQQCLWKVAR